ncbi:MAG: cytochrome c biogenesis protein ResB [Burkholderiaceae bacterium]|nr:cytochrome c biogenesis protein ResB [Burkholderiaceae bacterium]
MRFAIALLTVLCIASVIGTIIVQDAPAVNLIDQFGPFWGQLFLMLGLNAVYSTWWFLLILAFLVVSTSLCIARNTPKFLTDLRSYKENIHVQSLAAFHHKAQGDLPQTPQAAVQRIGQALAQSGWKVRLQARSANTGNDGASEPGWMVAAKAGSWNRIGYILAHSAIVLICLGGLFDGQSFVRAMTWFDGKSVYTGGGYLSQIGPRHRLSPRNPAFRGNLMVTEGASSSTAVLQQPDGVLLQDLPFAVELKKFNVAYYPNGMPRQFESDIVIHDLATGRQQAAKVGVNHPVGYKGIHIYQSSFDDGGSRVTLQALPMNSGGPPFTVQGVIGGSSQIDNGHGDKLRLELTGLRVLNVEDLAQANDDARAPKPPGNLASVLHAQLGAADKSDSPQKLRNVGPSISYKLRDAAGQAIEFNNYMRPVNLDDGVPEFLLGVRDAPGAPFRYLRIPADDQGTIQGFMRLRAALLDPALRERAVRRYVARVTDPQNAKLAEQLQQPALRTLDIFAGAEPVQGPDKEKIAGGFPALQAFVTASVPAAERDRAASVLLQILGGSLYTLENITREAAHQPPLPDDAATQHFMTQAVDALSDAAAYPAPVALMLQSYDQVQASVLQVTRSPGKLIVYLGCALLALGIFGMLYIHQRRLWVWLTPKTGGDGEPETHAVMALSATRQTLDTDREFTRLRALLLGAPPNS